MIRVFAPSRLHFGLIHPVPAGPWQGIDPGGAVAGRTFGGVGVMLAEPCTRVTMEPAAEWSATGPSSARALEFASRFCATLLPNAVHPQRIVVEQAPPAHCGFGTGTQLALAVAKALAVVAGHREWDSAELAGRTARGLRSAIGVHGFQHGGFIVDGGRGAQSRIAPMIARLPVPDEWRWLTLWPQDAEGLSGLAESSAFDKRTNVIASLAAAEALSRLIVLGLLPALVERDFSGFSIALFDYNARAGELFAFAQRGRYEGDFATDVVMQLRNHGIVGVGQSSWGPAVFAVLPDEESAQWHAKRSCSTGLSCCISTTHNTGSESVIF